MLQAVCSILNSCLFLPTAILLGSLKLPFKEIKRRILMCDMENIGASALENLIKSMPAADEMNKLAAMKDQYDELAQAEQFVIVVCAGLSACEYLQLLLRLKCLFSWYLFIDP